MADQRELDAEEREQHELVRPPDLNEEANRSSTRLELFFDLAFVLFVAQTADLLAQDASWSAAAAFAALMTVGWWSWASGTLYANRFDTDDVAFRALTLLGMAGVVGMAASVTEVSGPTGRWFALGYTLVRLGLVLGYLRAWRHVPEARPSILPYLAGHALGGAIWLVSVFVPVPARFVLWGVGLVVDLATPALAARTRGGVPLHVEHLPERFALFMILVLGESVAGVATGLHDGGWAPLVVVSAALAFLVTATAWWLYFDFSGGAAKRRLLEEEDETKGGVHDLYLYAHLPIVIGLAGLAVGLEHAVLHGADPHLEPGARAVLGAGLALYLASTALLQALLTGRTGAALLWPGGGVPLVLLATWADLRPPVLLALLGAVLLAGLATGIAQHRAGMVRTAKV
ncbi:MAG: low temperature requirement protein A [Actinomycetota bacterium]|nr:low temperature requirement protein A [Actinomycetota bacterium]